MVAILVLLTIIGFMLADWISQVVAARRARRKALKTLPSHAEFSPSQGYSDSPVGT